MPRKRKLPGRRYSLRRLGFNSFEEAKQIEKKFGLKLNKYWRVPRSRLSKRQREVAFKYIGYFYIKKKK